MRSVTSASALRRIPGFGEVSLRLLQDLVEFASDDLERLSELPDAIAPENYPLWLVLDGMLHVERQDGPDRRVDADRVYLARAGDTRFRATPRAGTLRVRAFRRSWLSDAVDSSFTLARTLGTEVDALMGRLGSHVGRLAHRIFLTAASDVAGPPLELLAEMLAIAITQQFAGERAAVVVLGPHGCQLAVWEGAGWRRLGVPQPLDVTRLASDDALRVLLGRARGRSRSGRAWHLIFTHPSEPRALPVWWPKDTTQWFHRILFLTPRWDWTADPSASPDVVTTARLLLPDLFLPDAAVPKGPFFSSFIPTVLGDAVPKPHSLREWMPRPFFTGLDTLRVAPIADQIDFTTRPEPVAPRIRLFRDRCRLLLDPAQLHRDWQAAGDKDQVSVQAMRNDAIRCSIERWARAVTNRQVGLALSGGGASSAALIPFIRKLQQTCPIDVVGGVSGGTLLGAYLCYSTSTGLTQYLGSGGWFLIGLLASVADSVVIERVLDRLLGRTRLEDLEARLVAVTTRLSDDEPPAASAVVAGTLGEAVRVSGAAPGLGPADAEDGRYLDGGSSVPVPARVLPDYGADLVFALNSIATVRGRNLLRALMPWKLLEPIADVWYRLSPLGRPVDGLVTWLTMLREASRQAAAEADVFFEVPAQTLPFLDGFEWIRLGQLAANAAATPGVWDGACIRSQKRWRDFAAAAAR